MVSRTAIPIGYFSQLRPLALHNKGKGEKIQLATAWIPGRPGKKRDPITAIGWEACSSWCSTPAGRWHYWEHHQTRRCSCKKTSQIVKRTFGRRRCRTCRAETYGEYKTECIREKASKKANSNDYCPIKEQNWNFKGRTSQVLSQAIPLEREAYSLDNDQSETMCIRYVVPDIKKPKWSGLSEDQ